MLRTSVIIAGILLLTGYDPMRFIVANDTSSSILIAHRFYRSNANCHTPEFMASKREVAAKNNVSLVCPASEIDYIELSQNGRSCHVGRADLMAMGRELKASACFENVRFSNDRSPH